MDDPVNDRVAALELEVAELRRQLAARPPIDDAAAFLQSLLAAVPAYIVRGDADMRVVYINRVQPGVTLEDVVGTSVWTHMPADAVKHAQACVATVLETGLPSTYQTVSIGPNGQLANYEVFVAPLIDRRGRPGVCFVAVDLTTLQARERELQRSEEELRIAVEATGIGLWRWMPSTNEVHWSPRNYEIYGRSVPVDMMDYIDVLVHPDDRALCRANAAGALAGGPFSGPIHRIIREDGGIRWILSRGRTELDANGHPTRMIGGSLDVTQQHELEQQVRHAQRLDAVGQLTAGVAHNFNNMLTVVTGTLEILAKRITDHNRRLIDDAHQAALRGAEMVRQLLTFSGQNAPPDRRPQQIGDLVQQVVEMCRRTFDRHIVLCCTVATNLPTIHCALNEIDQVVMNLLVNARDAITTDSERPASTITIAVDAIPDPGGSASTCVRITVTDDGIGMTDDILLRAFDPFFTTKATGRGTGLGLTTSYAIVRELDGTMTCESVPGRGTTFVVCIPGTTAAEPSTSHMQATPAAPRRILLIDDDDLLRNIVCDLLTIAHFEVDVVASGEAALAHLATHPTLDVILLDRSMPGAPGESYVPRIRALAPLIPIMMFTGQVVGPAIAALVDRVLLKPLTGTALVEAIDALLEKRAR